MRCEGFIRHGGAFTFGPVRWNQCEAEADVMLTVIQDGAEQNFPACFSCWKRAVDWPLIEVKEARPLLPAEKEQENVTDS